MRNIAKKTILISVLTVILSLGFFSLALWGGGAQAETVKLDNPLGSDDLKGLITKIANFFITLALPFGFFMMILAGFFFVTAQGNPEKVTKAKKNFVWTVVGLAVILSSKVLITYIQEVLGEEGDTLSKFIKQIKGTLNSVIVVLCALAFVYFFWGMVQFIGGAGNEQKVTEGKKRMIWGIVGMVIMFAAWSIVYMISAYVGGSGGEGSDYIWT